MPPAENPYAPPKTQELELQPEFVADRCRHVEWACTIMWISVGLSVLEVVLTTLFNQDSPQFASELIGGIVGVGIAFGLVYWFTLKLRAGRNWMRILVTVLTIIGTVLMVFGYVFLFTQLPEEVVAEELNFGPIQVVDMCLQTALSIAEVVLINTPTARDWFRARSNA
jgi:hypothetical protein